MLSTYRHTYIQALHVVAHITWFRCFLDQAGICLGIELVGTGGVDNPFGGHFWLAISFHSHIVFTVPCKLRQLPQRNEVCCTIVWNTTHGYVPSSTRESLGLSEGPSRHGHPLKNSWKSSQWSALGPRIQDSLHKGF